MDKNILFGWSWILAGIAAGALIGLRFADERWMGGYASHPRRLVRLGHISFIGLGILNILYGLSLAAAPGPAAQAASWSMIWGAVTMPACCFLMAWNKKLTMLFSLPVGLSTLGIALGLWLKLGAGN